MQEEQYRVPDFPVHVLPPSPPDFLAGKEGGYDDEDVMWEVDGILGLGLGMDHDEKHESELDSINDTKSLITRLPLQVNNGPGIGSQPPTTREDDHYFSDLLLKAETTSPINYGEEEEEEEEEDDDDGGFRRWAAQASSSSSSSSSSSLKLSLNYEKVLDAWSDRGSLWADINDSLLSSCNKAAAAAAAAAAITTGYMGEVPVLMEMEMEVEEKRCRRRRREASVLRYKEKRHSRLFSKKIRYQVRKLNADQRPRLKGRFVKKESGEDIYMKCGPHSL